MSAKPVNLTKHYIHTAIILFFFFGFGHLPAIGAITPTGMEVLGVFIGMIWGWMFVDMLWPSLLGLVVLGMSSYAEKGVLAVFQGAVSNKNVILVFLFFVFSAYMEASGLSNTIAMKMMTAKRAQGNPWFLILMVFMATYVLGVFIMTYAVIFLMWTIIYDMLKIAGYGKGDRISGFMLVGVVQIAGLSGLILPYQVFPNVCLNALTTSTGLTIATGPFIIYNFIITMIGTLAYYAAGRYILKIDVEKFKVLTVDDILGDRGMHFGRNEKIALGILVAFLIIILVPGFLPKTNALKVFYTRLSDQGLLAIVLCLLGLVMFKDGKLSNVPKLIKDGVNWNLMFLLMATFTVGDALQADNVGVMAQITASLSPIFNGMSLLVFLIVAFVILAITTQFVHNLVLAVVFIPLLCDIAISSGMGDAAAILICLGVLLVLMQSLCTPAASNRGALIFGNDWIGEKYAFRYGTLAVVVADLGLIIVGIPLGFLMF